MAIRRNKWLPRPGWAGPTDKNGHPIDMSPPRVTLAQVMSGTFSGTGQKENGQRPNVDRSTPFQNSKERN